MRNFPPPMPPPDIRYDRPPPIMNLNQPPPPIKPETNSSQPTQVRYPKEALNRSPESISKPWSKNVNENSFNFTGSPPGKQVCLLVTRNYVYVA